MWVNHIILKLILGGDDLILIVESIGLEKSPCVKGIK